MAGIPLKGGKELSQFLQAFPRRLQKGAVRAALTAAAAPIRDQARANVKKKSGKLARSIKTGRPRENADGSVTIRVRLVGEHSFIGPFLEYGVAAHFIAPGDSGISARLLTRRARNSGASSDLESGALKIGDNFIAGAILHPGFAAKPFLRPALDARAEDAVKAFADRIRDYLKGKSGFSGPKLQFDEAA